MGNYKDFLNSYCCSSTEEETKSNMLEMVSYKKDIEKVDSDMHKTFSELLVKQANKMGLKDFDMKSVNEYLVSDGLTKLSYIRRNENLSEMKEIIESLLSGQGIYDPMNEYYKALINTSKEFVNRVDSNEMLLLGGEMDSGEARVRDRIYSGGEKLYHNTKTKEVLNVYERVKLQRKAETIDNVLSDKEFEWEKFKKEVLVEEEVEKIEEKIESNDIAIETSNMNTKPKEVEVNSNLPIEEDIVTLRPGSRTLELVEEEIDLPWYTDEEKFTTEPKFIPSNKHRVEFI